MNCPICQKLAHAAYRPFCSVRCRERDLNKWFTASYAVAAVELDDVDAEALESLQAPEDQEKS